MIYAQKFETMDAGRLSFVHIGMFRRYREITSGEKLLELIKSELKGSANND